MWLIEDMFKEIFQWLYSIFYRKEKLEHDCNSFPSTV